MELLKYWQEMQRMPIFEMVDLGYNDIIVFIDFDGVVFTCSVDGLVIKVMQADESMFDCARGCIDWHLSELYDYACNYINLECTK